MAGWFWVVVWVALGTLDHIAAFYYMGELAVWLLV